MTTNPFALDKLLAFAESKPADEAYDAGNPNVCAFAQLTEHLGGCVKQCCYYFDGSRVNERASPAWLLAIWDEIGRAPDGWHTWGALAGRVRTALAKAQP